MFQVIISQRSRKSIGKLPEHYRRRMVPAEYYDVKKLRGYTDTYRVRIGEV